MADSGKELAKRFSEYSGKKDQYDVRVVEGVNGQKQTQLIDKDTGSVSYAVDGTDFDVDKVIGSVGGDPAVNPKEAVEDDKVFRTSRGNLATPTQPQALEGEVEPTEIDLKSGRGEAPTSSESTSSDSASSNSRTSRSSQEGQ